MHATLPYWSSEEHALYRSRKESAGNKTLDHSGNLKSCTSKLLSQSETNECLQAAAAKASCSQEVLESASAQVKSQQRAFGTDEQGCPVQSQIINSTPSFSRYFTIVSSGAISPCPDVSDAAARVQIAERYTKEQWLRMRDMIASERSTAYMACDSGKNAESTGMCAVE